MAENQKTRPMTSAGETATAGNHYFGLGGRCTVSESRYNTRRITYIYIYNILYSTIIVGPVLCFREHIQIPKARESI